MHSIRVNKRPYYIINYFITSIAKAVLLSNSEETLHASKILDSKLPLGDFAWYYFVRDIL